MRRYAVLLVAVLASAVAGPSTAADATPTPLCAPDAARGAVPAGFPIDACVDATTVTVHDDLPIPVLVHSSGDLGQAVRVRQRVSAAATVLRLTAAPDVLLLPGEVLRWPLGAAAADVVVSGPTSTSAAAIVDELARSLPAPGAKGSNQKDYEAFAVVLSQVAAALDARADCVAKANFLQAAACDVTTSSTIGRAIGALPWVTRVNLLPVLVNHDHWTTWADRRVGSAELPAAGARLSVAAQPAPVVVPPEPAATPAVDVSVPRIHSAPPVPAVAPPAPPPAPAPAVKVPAVPVRAVAPPVPTPQKPTWSDVLKARAERQAAAAAASKGQSGKSNNGNGKGNGKRGD